MIDYQRAVRTGARARPGWTVKVSIVRYTIHTASTTFHPAPIFLSWSEVITRARSYVLACTISAANLTLEVDAPGPVGGLTVERVPGDFGLETFLASSCSVSRLMPHHTRCFLAFSTWSATVLMEMARYELRSYHGIASGRSATSRRAVSDHTCQGVRCWERRTDAG